MKKSEVNNKHKYKYGKLMTFLFIWNFKLKILPYGRLLNYKARLIAHVRMKKMGSYLLRNSCSIGKLDKCKVTVSYINYT